MQMATQSKSVKFNISPAIGNISGEYIVPAKPSAILTLAHGAGAGMNHAFMVNLANSLAEADVATLRFNFPFIENKKIQTRHSSRSTSDD